MFYNNFINYFYLLKNTLFIKIHKKLTYINSKYYPIISILPLSSFFFIIISISIIIIIIIFD
jgi:hypothetical protein